MSLAACQRRAPEIQVQDAWARPAAVDEITAVYMTLQNNGASGDTLTAVRTPAAGTVELHRSEAGPEGVMRMRPVQVLPVPGNATVDLEPGGYHLMLIDLTRPLGPGERIPLTLIFTVQDSVTVEAVVRQQS